MALMHDTRVNRTEGPGRTVVSAAPEKEAGPSELNELERNTDLIGRTFRVRFGSAEDPRESVVLIERDAASGVLVITIDGKSYCSGDNIPMLGVGASTVIDRIVRRDEDTFRLESDDYGHADVSEACIREIVPQLAATESGKYSVPTNVTFVPREGSAAAQGASLLTSISGMFGQKTDMTVRSVTFHRIRDPREPTQVASIRD